MKSVFWKMFLVFSGIFLLSFLIMAGFFYFELDDFTYNREVELLDVVAGEIYLNAINIQSDITAGEIANATRELESAWKR